MAKFTLEIEDYEEFYNVVNAALSDYVLKRCGYDYYDYSEKKEFSEMINRVRNALEPIKKCVDDLVEIRNNEREYAQYLELKKKFEKQ
jgi:hypothetical protein